MRVAMCKSSVVGELGCEGVAVRGSHCVKKLWYERVAV